MSARTFTVATQTQVERLCAWLTARVAEHALSINVDRWRNQRTNNSNRRLFELHTRAAEASGMSVEELHRDACGEFFGWNEVEFQGRRIRVPKRTTTWPDRLDAETFRRFMEWREAQYASYLGVWL